ncbi:MAG: hypothetical protein ACXQTV_03530 [Candidatus Hecatellaceae archaeon]
MVAEEAPAEKMPIDLPGLTEEMRREIEERVSEFERLHEPEVARGGAGWVSRVKARDYIIALIVNLIIIVYWIIGMLTSGWVPAV